MTSPALNSIVRTIEVVLVTGTAGSGKSITLAAFVDPINRTRCRHIVTIEDPIEFERREMQCMIQQREVASHVDSFATGSLTTRILCKTRLTA